MLSNREAEAAILMVIDEFLNTLNVKGFYSQRYADDIEICITGKFARIVTELRQQDL